MSGASGCSYAQTGSVESRPEWQAESHDIRESRLQRHIKCCSVYVLVIFVCAGLSMYVVIIRLHVVWSYTSSADSHISLISGLKLKQVPTSRG